MLKRFFLCLVLTCLVFSISYAQQKVWVTSASANLKADKSASSETVAELAMGEELAVISMQSPWIEVQTFSGKQGWIYRGRVSNSPPAKETQGETDNLLSGAFGSSISVTEADTDRSIRGLSKETEQYAKNTGTPLSYQKALDRVLDFSVTEKEVDAFLRQGRVGEYAY